MKQKNFRKHLRAPNIFSKHCQKEAKTSHANFQNIYVSVLTIFLFLPKLLRQSVRSHDVKLQYNYAFNVEKSFSNEWRFLFCELVAQYVFLKTSNA